MGDYPTSGTRGNSSAGSGGSPTGSGYAGAAAAGFLSPAAARAMQDAMRPKPVPPVRPPPVRLPATPPIPAPVANALGATAAAGLARSAARAIPYLGAALLAWELYQWYMARQGSNESFDYGSYRVTINCGGSRQMIKGGLATCGARNYPDTLTDASALPPGQPYYTSYRYDGLTLQGQKTGYPVERFEKIPGALAPFKTPTITPAAPPMWTPAAPEFQPDPAPMYDPMSRPPGAPQPVLPMPYPTLPGRVTNPNRSPTEQPRRGNTAPLNPWGPLLPGQEGNPMVEGQPTRPQPSRTLPVNPDSPEWAPVEWPGRSSPVGPPATPPGRRPLVDPPDGPGRDREAEPSTPPRTRPRVPPLGDPENVPGTDDPSKTDGGTRPGVGVPTTNPFPNAGTRTGPPPIREEHPVGAAGPTIVVGGGPPIGPHIAAPPGPKTKERKGRFIQTGSSLLIRAGVNPATEALEALDCAYKALPKGIRWEVQKADWQRQRAEAARAGVKLTKRPADGLDTKNAPKIDLSGGGLEGQTLTVPGGINTRNPKYADPNANHVQPLSPQDKATAVYRHAKEMDLNAFASCMVADQMEDIAFGAVGNALKKAAQRNRRGFGYTIGETF